MACWYGRHVPRFNDCRVAGTIAGGGARGQCLLAAQPFLRGAGEFRRHRQFRPHRRLIDLLLA